MLDKQCCLFALQDCRKREGEYQKQFHDAREEEYEENKGEQKGLILSMPSKKTETKKRILANSEDNATIIITNICKSYNRSCGMRVMIGLNELTPDRRTELGFEF